ncbi:hypothetical protein D3C71_1380200 [compost metagenome]
MPLVVHREVHRIVQSRTDEPLRDVVVPDCLDLRRAQAGIGGVVTQPVVGGLAALGEVGEALRAHFPGEVIHRPERLVAQPAGQCQPIEWLPFQLEAELLLRTSSGTRQHPRGAVDRLVPVVVVRAQRFMLVAAAQDQLQFVGQRDAVAQGHALARVVGVRQCGVAQVVAVDVAATGAARIRLDRRTRIIRPATTAVGVADGIGLPEVGVQVDPAIAFGLPLVFQVVGFGIDTTQRPLRHAMGRGIHPGDARGHDLAVVRQRVAYAQLHHLVIADAVGEFAQPRFHLA